MPRAGSRGKATTQHIDEIADEGVAHIVFMRRCAPVELKKIRNVLFSDLRNEEEGLLQKSYKKKPDCCA
ncbi:hypothetical protein FG683_012405 [Salmonella enterica subsp. enterica serovar Senftenberg]|uniref:Uncharacterized protein n=1 Tax=uncultured Citrobacter sp. TaxID=200446 RepID=A0A212IMH2_9ENTR|nr:hypothetical protein [Salmonella enterica]EAF5631403.1 hypothetical protein [Salmonella enterica subsp. enterica serovar Senftenberg]EDD0653450.1 hypothetical protein [Salmonella enterica subsp. enterica serovar Westhampton]SBV67869.1 conserved hypothetical protein [uncultured Citrobacter sp.]EAN3153392.1 hypothetical protein [Salmonella enterica]